MMNRFKVGAVGKRITIGNIAPEPELTSKQALELAAWLVATAAPLEPEDANVVLGKFLGMVSEAGDDEELSAAAAELQG